MKKKLFLLIISAVLLLVAACSGTEGNAESSSGGDEKQSGKPTVAVVLKGADQEYFKLAEAGAKQAFKDFDVNGKFLAASTQTKEQELINILEDLLTDKPDALVVMPSTESAIPTLSKYTDKDIPVLLIDTNLNWDEKLTYIGIDNYTAGQKAAEHLASLLSKGDEIAILEGVSGAAVNEERVRGVKDYMKEAGIKIATSQSADFDRTKAVNTMENILTANPGIKGVFSANDAMSLGALKATTSNGVNIPIVGVDGTADGLESIAAGEVTATVGQNPYNMSYLGVENALKAIKGESVDREIDSGIELITEENAAEHLEKVKEMLGKK
ncbi:MULTISPECIES: sugar ABC transporter substrate-binding protein [unclassified Sporosarcina]|uniref:sugar ABC transporter substrate-binding protein n=1 Tax=unclassified Sporosarcina TaxID=2647733 RepID=UPI0020426239|nr:MULTISPECIES: sugar ABC transporter substrate-binding protein [unclassified Sporosarcina]GKV65853.1 D-ribose ABC transporter substrate-binding protein [Sporosarcina sp. NCCP-2331]GLB55978.1 D-ribose ABC transporter substrate-binding protein [Sporosarcina sp. NCCP-2378]